MTAMERHVLLVGIGPLPAPQTRRLCAYNLRTAKLAWHLRRSGVELEVCAVDLFPEGEPAPRTSGSLVGPCELLPDGEAGRAHLLRRISTHPPRAIVATGGKAATMVCEINPGLPIWADLPGWLMSEAQLKAEHDGDDHALAYYGYQETTVLRRADKVSVVAEAQKQVTLGELALLGRLGRRNSGHELLHRIPSLGFDWGPLLSEAGAGARDVAAGIVPGGAPVLLWSGSLNLWTDLGWLEPLLGELMAAVPDLHFVATGRRIAGYNDGPCDALERIVAAAPYHDRCHLLDWLPFADAMGWVRRATLGLCVDGDNIEVPYGSRTRVVEMLAQGLPVAATVGTELTRELAAAGAIVPLEPADRASWASRIATVLVDGTARGELAKTGQRLVLAEHGLDACCAELVAWARAPRLAPDNEFAVRVGAAPGVAPSPAGGADDGLRASRPMVTWRPQADVERAATEGLAPAFSRRSARAVRRALPRLLRHAPTRLPILAAWNVASRTLPWGRLARWQSYIDDVRPPEGEASLGERLSRSSARRIYGRVLSQPGNPGHLKAANVLLASSERDVTSSLAAWPQRIEIEPSSACNIRCRQCQLTHWNALGHLMKPEVFHRVSPYFRYAPIVEFIGRGEPTLNAHLPEFMQAASSAGCWVRMFTNGTRFTPELSASMVKSGVDEIVLSLLGGDAESYRFITEKDEFDHIVDNFRTLRDVKRHLGSETPRLSICSTLLAGSLDSAPDVVRTAAKLQITTIHFGASYVIMPEMERESLMNQPREHVEAVFAECRRLAHELGIAIMLPPLAAEADVAPPMAENRFGCLKPWQSVLVRADGQVEVCSYNRKIVGDLRSDDFGAIWNGPEFTAFRRDEVRYQGANLCDVCYHRAFRGRRTSSSTQFPYAVSFDGYR